MTPNNEELEKKEDAKVKKMELAKSKGTKRKLVRDDEPEKNKDKPNRKKRHLEEVTDPYMRGIRQGR